MAGKVRLLPRVVVSSGTPCPPRGPGTMGMKDLMNSLSDSKGGSSGL